MVGVGLTVALMWCAARLFSCWCRVQYIGKLVVSTFCRHHMFIRWIHGLFHRRLYWCVTLIISFCFMSTDVFAKGGAAHIQDALRIALNSNAKNDSPLWDMVSYISQGMDYGKKKGGDGIADAGSGFLKTIRAEFDAEGYSTLKGLGQHHYYSHWDFNGAIPKEMLEKIRGLSIQGKLPSDAEARFILRWRQFVFSRTQAVKQVFNLYGDGSDRVARSFASIVDDIHNLGDWAFDKDVAGLRPVDEVVNNYLKSCNKILGKHNNLIMAIKQEIKNLNRLPAKEYAQAVIKILESHGSEMRERLYRVFTRYGFKDKISTIDYAAIVKDTAALDMTKTVAMAADEEVDDLARLMSIGRIFKANPIVRTYELNVAKASEKIADRLNVTLEKTFTQDQRLAKFLVEKGCTEIKSTIGIIQTITLKDGTAVKVLHVPVENVMKGINTGISSGVMTFVFSEGITCYCYFKGDINKDKFVLETAKNCSSALLTGTATFVAVTLGATPGGPVVLGIGIGTYMLCDITFTRIERAIEYRRFHIEDMLGEFPVEFQRRRSTIEHAGYENLLSYTGNRSLIGFKRTTPSALEYQGGGRSLLDVKPNVRSLLEQ